MTTWQVVGQHRLHENLLSNKTKKTWAWLRGKSIYTNVGTNIWIYRTHINTGWALIALRRKKQHFKANQ